MPAEFEPHAGCWMLWPERTDNWRLGARPAQAAFAAVATAIARSEPVTVGVSARQRDRARAALPPEVRVVELPCNDAWMRDVGPTFLVNEAGARRGVDWEFNAWGGLNGGFYSPWDDDDLVARKVLEIEGCDRYRAPFVLEGGAIHVDGQGTVITTEQCLGNPNRNPTLSKDALERLLHDYLGTSVVVWLESGVFGDEAGGHIDNLCGFVRPGEVVLTWTEDRADPQYRISRDAHERLMAVTDARGRRLKVHRLVQPDPLHVTAEELRGVDRAGSIAPRPEGHRMAASYVNFYTGNSVVVMPLFDSPHDERAADTLRDLFPDRRVVGVRAREILLGGGNVHCITQQVPRARAGEMSWHGPPSRQPA